MTIPVATQRAGTADGTSKTIIDSIDEGTVVEIYFFDSDTNERELLAQDTVTGGTLELTYDTPGWYLIEFRDVQSEDPEAVYPITRVVVRDYAD